MTCGHGIVNNTEEAEALLVEGNERFLENMICDKNISLEKRIELSQGGQKPFAVILCCSDSRVPPEIIFDQGLGELFVVRNAGNVVDCVTLGSIEYGVAHLGAPLVVVLGHEKCGAVKATVDGEKPHGCIEEIINMIKPSLEKAKNHKDIDEDLYCLCEDENIMNSVRLIRNSPIIQKFEKEDKVKILGTKYGIEDENIMNSVRLISEFRESSSL